jgi:hypothetical protein
MPVTETFPLDGGAGDGGVPAGCTETCNSGTLTDDCSTTTQGYTTTSDVTITLNSTGATGTVTETSTGPDGGVLSNCTYTLTTTKQ